MVYFFTNCGSLSTYKKSFLYNLKAFYFWNLNKRTFLRIYQNFQKTMPPKYFKILFVKESKHMDHLWENCLVEGPLPHCPAPSPSFLRLWSLIHIWHSNFISESFSRHLFLWHSKLENFGSSWFSPNSFKYLFSENVQIYSKEWQLVLVSPYRYFLLVYFCFYRLCIVYSLWRIFQNTDYGYFSPEYWVPIEGKACIRYI